MPLEEHTPHPLIFCSNPLSKSGRRKSSWLPQVDFWVTSQSAQPTGVPNRLPWLAGKGSKIWEHCFFLKLKLRFLAQQKTRNGVFRPPPGSWLAPLGIQMDPRSSADAVNKRNGLHQCAHPQAIVDKKTEFSLLKKRSQILAPLTQKSSGGSRFFSVFSTFSYRTRAK